MKFSRYEECTLRSHEPGRCRGRTGDLRDLVDASHAVTPFLTSTTSPLYPVAISSHSAFVHVTHSMEKKRAKTYVLLS